LRIYDRPKRGVQPVEREHQQTGTYFTLPPATNGFFFFERPET
jgi:hypothetical protein